jgi:hypothetical protein
VGQGDHCHEDERMKNEWADAVDGVDAAQGGGEAVRRKRSSVVGMESRGESRGGSGEPEPR